MRSTLNQEPQCVNIEAMSPTEPMRGGAADGGVVRPYRGIPADARVAERRARLLAAALDEIAGGGVAALSVRAICARAGLTRRYFYESFGDLDALLLAAFDDLHGEIADAIVAALAPSAARPSTRARGPRSAPRWRSC